MIGKITKGSSGRALIRYLFGPGKANEHTDPHLVAGFSDPLELEPDRRPDGSRDLRRLSDPQDRRRVLVEVTELGRQRGRAAFSGLQEGTDQLLRRYSPGELGLLSRFVEEVRAVVAGQAAEAASAAVTARGQKSAGRAGR